MKLYNYLKNVDFKKVREFTEKEIEKVELEVIKNKSFKITSYTENDEKCCKKHDRFWKCDRFKCYGCGVDRDERLYVKNEQIPVISYDRNSLKGTKYIFEKNKMDQMVDKGIIKLEN
jgi:hypothetical protein